MQVDGVLTAWGGVPLPAMFGIEVHHRGDRTVLAVGGALDLATAPGFRQALTNAVADGARHLVVDLSACDFLDSVGAGLLLGARKRAATVEGSVVLVCTEARIRQVLALTGLDQLVPVADGLEAALAGPPPAPVGVSGRA